MMSRLRSLNVCMHCLPVDKLSVVAYSLRLSWFRGRSQVEGACYANHAQREIEVSLKTLCPLITDLNRVRVLSPCLLAQRVEPASDLNCS
jgi:hypothetical protein